MIKILQRKSDNKYLQSAKNDIWVDNISDAFEMNIAECDNIKALLSNYTDNDLKEILNFNKIKIASREERKELRNIFK